MKTKTSYQNITAQEALALLTEGPITGARVSNNGETYREATVIEATLESKRPFIVPLDELNFTYNYKYCQVPTKEEILWEVGDTVEVTSGFGTIFPAGTKGVVEPLGDYGWLDWLAVPSPFFQVRALIGKHTTSQLVAGECLAEWIPGYGYTEDGEPIEAPQGYGIIPEGEEIPGTGGLLFANGRWEEYHRIVISNKASLQEPTGVRAYAKTITTGIHPLIEWIEKVAESSRPPSIAKLLLEAYRLGQSNPT